MLMQWFSNSTSQHDSSMILIDGRIKLIMLVLRGAICITSPSCKCFEEAFGTITPMMNRQYDHMQRKSTCYSSMHQFICSSHGQRAACLAHVSPRGLRGLPIRPRILRIPSTNVGNNHSKPHIKQNKSVL